MSRYPSVLGVGAAALTAMSISVLATSSAQAALPDSSLSPTEFSQDLGFDNLRTMN
ncbi:MAG: hypothetical protein RLZZ597_2600, partial [Cyanobacteriota bacterium]